MYRKIFSRNFFLFYRFFRILESCSYLNTLQSNKEFLKYMYDYIIHFDNEIMIADRRIPMICPVSNAYCEALSTFYIKLSQIYEKN